MGKIKGFFKLTSAGMYPSASDVFNAKLIYVMVPLSLHRRKQKSSTIRDIKAALFFRLQSNVGTASFTIIMLQPQY
jgi:hypothetical protein